MATHAKQPERPVILDCTIRDGNYAIDFQFTEYDTGLLVRHLSRLGFEWIEVGHGLGLGAAAAGKTRMPSDDAGMIRVARENAGSAKIGVFFIPGIGDLDDIKAAADAGLDFIRIGYDVDRIEKALPFLDQARQLGLTPCLNMMKSYAITPEEFAAKARMSESAGAEAVYFVDSAGYMLPDDLAAYFDAASAEVDCLLGFHGHDNLTMANINCVVAFRHGATLLDTSLCGMGRSAGNASTEILIAVLERMGIPTGIDLFAVMDVGDRFMWPLLAQTRTHDMMSVAAGYSGFHSSFLPQVAKAAVEHQSELRRLVAAVAQRDPVRIDTAYLDQAAADLAGTATGEGGGSLVGFQAPQLSPSRISNTMAAVSSLLDAMVVSSAKQRNKTAVLHLVPSESPLASFVHPECVLDDDQVVMGRVTFGSEARLEETIELARDKASLLLVSRSADWAANAEQLVRELAPACKVRGVVDRDVKRAFLLEVLHRAAETFGHESLLLYKPDDLLLDVLRAGTPFDSTFLYGIRSDSLQRSGTVVIDNWDDWRELMLRFNVIVCGRNPSYADAGVLAAALTDGGRILSAAPMMPATALLDAAAQRLVQIDLNKAYAGLVERLIAAENALVCHAH